MIIKNCHFTAAKQRRRRGTVPLPEENDVEYGEAMISTAPDPERVTMLRDESRTWDRLIAAMPEEQRLVLLLREIEEMDYAQIAVVTNVPIGTVMSRLARSRATLKAHWLKECEERRRAVR